MDLGALFNPQGPPTPGQDTWSQAFQDPRMLSAMLSIGGALAQPPAFGQSGFGHLMSGLGAGAESARTIEKLNQTQAEQDSKAQLRESQANTAAERSGAAASRVDTASARLALQEQGMKHMDERNRLGNIMRFQRSYQDHVKQIQKENQNAALLNQPLKPVPTFQEFAATNPQISGILGLRQPDIAAADSGDIGTQPPAPSEGAPPAPRDPKARSPGWYATPNKGRLYWTGSIWRDTP